MYNQVWLCYWIVAAQSLLRNWSGVASCKVSHGKNDGVIHERRFLLLLHKCSTKPLSPSRDSEHLQSKNRKQVSSTIHGSTTSGSIFRDPCLKGRFSDHFQFGNDKSSLSPSPLASTSLMLCNTWLPALGLHSPHLHLFTICDRSWHRSAKKWPLKLLATAGYLCWTCPQLWQRRFCSKEGSHQSQLYAHLQVIDTHSQIGSQTFSQPDTFTIHFHLQIITQVVKDKSKSGVAGRRRLVISRSVWKH